MRQLSPQTNLVLACLSALGLLATLGLPWYAQPVAGSESAGQVEHLVTVVRAVFGDGAGQVTGAEALGELSRLLAGVVVLLLGLCALAGVPAMRRHVRDPLRVVALGPLAVVGYRLAVPPAGDAAPHWGLLVAIGAALACASACWHGSAIRRPRQVTGSWERRAA